MNAYRAELRKEIERIREAYDFAAEADAGFDGGEWSGPAADRACEEEIQRFLAAHEAEWLR